MKVLNLNTAAVLTSMLETVIESGTAKRANIGKPAAAKTGTTDDNKDASFYGYTPDVVTGIWVGRDDNTKTGGIYGGTVPAAIWKDTMTVLTEKFGASKFDYPEVQLKRNGNMPAKTETPSESDNDEEAQQEEQSQNPDSGTPETENPQNQAETNPNSFNNTFLNNNAKPPTPPTPPAPPLNPLGR